MCHFTDRYEMRKHLPELQCTGLSKILFPCHFCQKIFTRKDNLRDDLRCHINLQRKRMLQKRDYKCYKCAKEYGGQTILSIHMLSHHQHKKRPHTSQKVIAQKLSKNAKKVKEEPIEIKSEPF